MARLGVWIWKIIIEAGHLDYEPVIVKGKSD